MDENLSAYLAAEEAKLRLLEQEVEARRKRVAALRAAVEAMGQSSALDAVLSEQIAPPAKTSPAPSAPSTGAAKQTSLNPQAAWPFPTAAQPDAEAAKPQQRRRGEVKSAVIECLGGGARHITEVQALLREQGLEFDYNRVRYELWALKGQNLVENVGKGLYALTDEGKALLFKEASKGETPGGAGVSGATNRLLRAA